ncbi:MAG: DUF2007 domain-containing protein, partial [Phycisphaerales bacterium]|nr:DUF2007 domain-containing protein [Phycisphaerales bacterium]
MSKDLVTLTTAPSEFEANLLAIVLRDHNIEAFVFASSSSGLGVSLSSGTIGVPLQVRADDIAEAKRILASNKRDSIDIDWDELELAGQDFSETVVHKPVTMRLPAKIAF